MKTLSRGSNTLSPVPLHVFAPGARGAKLSLDTAAVGQKAPGLANLAASVLTLLGYAAPEDYEASLVRVD